MKPDHLTKLPGVPDSSQAVPGMAYFAGTGPWNTTCGGCEHRGYRRTPLKGAYDEKLKMYVDRPSYKYSGCAMFRSLTGKYGPAVDENNPSCKYFEAKKGGR